MQSPMVPLNAPQGDGRGPGMVVVSMPEHPPDYTVWSIATFFYGNPCCLGLMALSFSMKYHLFRDRKMLGDMTGAMTRGSKARLLNIIALVLMIIPILIVVVILATSVSRASHHQHYNRYH